MDYDDIATSDKLTDYVSSLIKDEKKHYLIIDEIQRVINFEQALIFLRNNFDISIFISGFSKNSYSYQKVIPTILKIYKLIFVFPFNFKEAYDYQVLNGIYPKEGYFEDYFKWGGFPERFLFNNTGHIYEYLKNLYEGMIEKIIFDNPDINSYFFKDFASYIISFLGREFSEKTVLSKYNKLYEGEFIFTSEEINHYLALLRENLIISYFDLWARVDDKNRISRKQYVIDNGLVNIQPSLPSRTDSYCLENVLSTELMNRGFNVHIGHTRRKSVDFKLIKDYEYYHVQVTTKMLFKKTIERETNALLEIKDDWPKIIMSLEDNLDLSTYGITHINIVDFLVGKVDLPLT